MAEETPWGSHKDCPLNKISEAFSPARFIAAFGCNVCHVNFGRIICYYPYIIGGYP